MKKLINQPEAFVDEMLEGLLLAHGCSLRSVRSDNRALIRADSPRAGKVGIVTGGGSGHLPVFLGYVGEGLADGVAVGGVFQSPGAEQILSATQGVNGGAGVLYLFGNYQGDVLNFEMAGELAEMEDIPTRTVLVSDDVASAPPEEWQKRRGVAGLFFAYKIAGAKAESMASLEEVEAVAKKVVANTRSMGVALTPCTVPEVGRPSFSIGDDEMEIGMGIHGEPGISRTKLRPADEVAAEITQRIVSDLPFKGGDEVAVLVNGLGSTCLEELYIMFRRVAKELEDRDISIYRTYVGEYATSLEMAGCSVTLLKLDGELKELLDAPAHSPFFEQIGR
ncbi:MAG: dihydroxyacetone kinase subunit DhaK [Firmicutes bacterium]|nr:dihydroxyacetone kinase subunit DhaK [Bacillota bacterium]